MFIFLPAIPVGIKILTSIPVIGPGIKFLIDGVVVVGGLIIVPSVSKASSNAINLIKDSKSRLDTQKIIKKINEYDEQIGTIIINKKLKFKHDMIMKEIKILRENIAELEKINKMK